MVRFFAKGHTLTVDFPTSTKTWDFHDVSNDPMKILAVHTFYLQSTECFAVALQSKNPLFSEIRLLCTSTSTTEPIPLTVLIITFDNSQIYPTAFASTDGGNVASSLCGKTLLSVGLSNGQVFLFNLNMAFRLNVCRENAQRTSSASAYTFENLKVKCGREVVLLNIDPNSTNANHNNTNVQKVCALEFIEAGGSFAEAAIAVVREKNQSNRQMAQLQVAYLDPEPNRTKQHVLDLSIDTMNTVGWTLGHVHHQEKVGGNLVHLEKKKNTLFTIVCSKKAFIFTTLNYTETLWNSNSSEKLLDGSRCKEHTPGMDGTPSLDIYLGMEILTGKRALLVSADSKLNWAAVRVQLIQLETNEVLFTNELERKTSTMHWQTMAANMSSLCISCKMSYSATQLESGKIDNLQHEVVDRIGTYTSKRCSAKCSL